MELHACNLSTLRASWGIFRLSSQYGWPYSPLVFFQSLLRDRDIVTLVTQKSGFVMHRVAMFLYDPLSGEDFSTDNTRSHITVDRACPEPFSGDPDGEELFVHQSIPFVHWFDSSEPVLTKPHDGFVIFLGDSLPYSIFTTI